MALMVAYGAVSFLTGLYFYALGAWPVLGFFGLDALALFAAFKISYRDARWIETIALAPGELIVTRDGPGRQELCERFNPYWLRVEVVERDADRCELRLSSKGRSLAIGKLLSDPERRELAVVLRAAIAGAKA